ncbi:hypothetical protein EV145_102503 [Flavobacterium sp. 245]|nr:hypothetical protein EV145_102503 [Flavobacterium sp. 245]
MTMQKGLFLAKKTLESQNLRILEPKKNLK